jgi:cytochrome c oxidase cbb3-type subunit 1
MDLFAVFPLETSLYPRLLFFHKNLFFYGVFLNIIPSSIEYLLKNQVVETTEKNKNLIYKLFWVYQVVLLLALISILSGYHQSINFFEFSWVFDVVLAVILIIYLYLMSRIHAMTPSFRFIWKYFLFFPLIMILFYFLILNISKPVGLLQSVPVFGPYSINLFSSGFHYQLYKFFLPLFFFAIIYLITPLDIELSSDFIVSIKIQWLLHLSLSTMGLFFYLQFLIGRYSGPWTQTALMAAYIPFFAGLINLRYLNQLLYGTKYPAIFGFILLIYTLGQIIGDFKYLGDIFMFTNWFTAQAHLVSAGIVLPLLFLLVIPKSKAEHYRRFANMGLVLLLIFAVISWVMGAVESALWYKENPFRFLEFPGWISISTSLFPVRFLRLAFDIFILIFVFKIIFKLIRSNESLIHL